MLSTGALFSQIEFPRAAVYVYGELNPDCHVQNADLLDGCGPKTLRYYTCDTGGCANYKRSDDAVPLAIMVDRDHTIDKFLSEDKYWFYKQLFLDSTAEFLKRLTIPRIPPFNPTVVQLSQPPFSRSVFPEVFR